MSRPIHNVLFDGPTNTSQPILVGQNHVVKSIDSIYNVKLFKTFLQTYMGLLLAQYVLVYGCVPFDDIENRPSIMIISSLYCLFMFSVNACILPVCSSTIPTLMSFRCLILSSIFELLGLALNIASVVIAFNVPSMYSFEYDEKIKKNRKLDVTRYMQITTTVAMTINCLAFFVSILNVIIASHALKNLFNKIDRRLEVDDPYASVDEDLPSAIVKEQRKLFIS